MGNLKVSDIAPNFSLPDQTGKRWVLSEQYRSQNVLLVFNLGFI